MDLEAHHFKGKKVLVVGMARSGIAVAKFLLAQGALLTVSDRRSRRELEAEIQKLESLGIRCEVDSHRPETFLAADCIVVSPGVPLGLPVLKPSGQQGGRDLE